MPPSIFDHLDEMRAFADRGDWDGLETRFAQLATDLAGAKPVRRIAGVDLSTYQQQLAEGLHKAVRQTEAREVPAVYFEYDLDNGWSGTFFLCETYNALSEGDDDWACDFSEHIAGPDLPVFSELYKEAGGFDRTPLQVATTTLLVARTVAAFGRASADVTAEAVNICIAFHDQDPILRIREHGQP